MSQNVSTAAVVIGALRVKFHFHEFQPTTCSMDSQTMPYTNARCQSTVEIQSTERLCHVTVLRLERMPVLD